MGRSTFSARTAVNNGDRRHNDFGPGLLRPRIADRGFQEMVKHAMNAAATSKRRGKTR
jgi:hypothetical protein